MSVQRSRPRWQKGLYAAAALALLIGGLSLDVVLMGHRAVALDAAGTSGGFVKGFFGQEWSDALPEPTGPVPGSYRWMEAQGLIRLAPIRSGWPLLLRLRLSSGRPAEAARPQVQVRVYDRLVGPFPLEPTVREYAFLVPADLSRDRGLTVAIATETFRPATDSRDLGLVFVGARLEAVGSPAVRQEPLRFLTTVPLAYGVIGLAATAIALALGLTFWPASGIGAALLLVVAALVAWQPGLARQVGLAAAGFLLAVAGLAWAIHLVNRHCPNVALLFRRYAGLVPLALLLAGTLLAFFLGVRMPIFFLVSSTIWLSYFLWLRRHYDSLADTAAGAFLLTVFQILATQMILGAFGWLRWEVVYGTNLLLATLLWAVLGQKAGPLLQGTWLRVKGAWKALTPFAKVVLFLLLLAACWSALVIYYAPAHDTDGSAYHIPIAILRAQ